MPDAMRRQRPAAQPLTPAWEAGRVYALCAIVFAVAAALSAPTPCADTWLYLAVGTASLAAAVSRGRGAERLAA